MGPTKTSISPLYLTSFQKKHKTMNQSLNLPSKRIAIQQERSTKDNPSTKRRSNGGFYSSTCCKGIIAALITTAIVAAFVLPFAIIINNNKGIESTTTTASATASPSTTTTGVTTASPSTTTTGASTAGSSATTTGATTASSSTTTTGASTASPTATTTGATTASSSTTTTGATTASPSTTTTGASTAGSSTTTTGATTASPSTTMTGVTTASPTVTTTTITSSSTSTSTTTTALHTGWNTTAKTVAGTISSGTSATRLNGPVGLAIDSFKTLYIADRFNNRSQKWLNGASNGTTVGGSSSGIAGSSVYYLNIPLDVEVDSSGNVYIADTENHRVVLWTVGAASGTVVAGTGIQGSTNNQLYRPYGIVHDWSTGILYIADTYNDRIMSYASGASTGTMCIGGTGMGTTQLNFPTGVYFDSSSSSLYIANTQANNIVRWVVGASNWILVAGSSSGTAGMSSTLLNYPRDVTLDYMKNVYVADCNNNYIQFFKAGQSNGTTIAGSVTGLSGSSSILLNSPIALVVDSDFNVYVADYFNNRVQRFDHY